MREVYSFDDLSIPLWVKALFWGLYMVVFVYAVWKLLLSDSTNRRKTDACWLIILFFATYTVFYCVNPDYFRYRDWIYGRNFDFWDKEAFYVYVILFCRSLPFDYPFEVFRLIVWGGAVLITWFVFRNYRQQLLPSLTLVLLFVLYSNTFSYARASLAMAVYFLGASLLLHSKKLVIKLLGIVVAVFSYSLHHEMIIGVALLFGLILPFEKKQTSFLSIFLLLAGVVVISYVNTHLDIFDSMLEDDDLASKIDEFNDQEQGAFRMSTLVKYLNFFYPFFLVTKCLWKRKVPRSIAGMYRISYAILLASVAFMIVFGMRSVFVYRVMYIAMIPLALLVSYCYCNRLINNRQVLFMLMLSLLSNSIRLINAT